MKNKDIMEKGIIGIALEAIFGNVYSDRWFTNMLAFVAAASTLIMILETTNGCR